MYRKRKMSSVLGRSAAVVTTAAMVLGAPAAVMAEGEVTYRDREKAALQVISQALAEEWDKGLAEMEETGANATVEMKLTVDDAGRSLLGILYQTDISWLESIGLNMDVSVSDGKEAVAMAGLVNDSQILTMDMFIDLLSYVEYVRIPELSGAYLKADMIGASGDEGISTETMENLMGLASDPAFLFSEGSVISELLERYGNIVIDHFQEGPSIEESVSVEGISEDCTLLEGQLYATDITEMAKDLLTTAQADEQLEELFAAWSEAVPEAGDLNEQFQSYAAEALASLEAEEAESESADNYIASRIWVNGDDRIVGREIAVCEGIDSETIFLWKNPESEDSSALLLEVQSDGSGFTVTGSGSKVDGVLNGNYGVAFDGITTMEVAVENYDSQADGVGYPAGTFTITFPQAEGEEEYNPLSAFSLVAEISSSQADDSSDLTVTVLSSDASLGSLKIHALSTDKVVETVAEEDMETIYDMTSEEDMNAYADELSFDTILSNLESAGVPAALVDVIDQSLEAAMTEVPEELPADDLLEITEEAAES